MIAYVSIFLRFWCLQENHDQKVQDKLATVPEEKRMIIIMMTNSFIAGMETQGRMDKKTD